MSFKKFYYIYISKIKPNPFMKKTKKIKLDSLNIQSFVTSLDEAKIKGGTATPPDNSTVTHNYCASNVCATRYGCTW